jgi:putative ABC transport system permease protein
MRKLLRQTSLLTLSGLHSLSERRGVALVTIISVAAVVGVLISLLAVREGTSLFQSARADEAFVLSRGASNVTQSAIPREAVALIAETPGVKKGVDGRPYAYAAVVISVDALRRDGKRGAVSLAGYTGGWELVEPDIKVVAGRFYRPAVRELVVSESIHKMFRGFDVGEHITLHGMQWTVVGVFASGDSQSDGFLRADAETVLSAFGRNSFGQVKVRLESPAAFRLFADSLDQNPAIAVEVKTAAQQFEQSFGNMRRLLTFVAWFIGSLMAAGAICGALNSLYASVDARQREIATLRALGFNAVPVVTSVLVESLLLALPGAVLGALVAWFLFNGNFVNSGGLLFKLSVTPNLVAMGIGLGLVIGLVGGSLPALHAARQPVAAALRAT